MIKEGIRIDLEKDKERKTCVVRLLTASLVLGVVLPRAPSSSSSSLSDVFVQFMQVNIFALFFMRSAF